jgi:hypothetical protein
MDLIEPDSEFESAGELHIVLCVAISLIIIRGETAEEFLQWARDALPHLFPSAFEGIDPARHAQAAHTRQPLQACATAQAGAKLALPLWLDTQVQALLHQSARPGVLARGYLLARYP